MKSSLAQNLALAGMKIVVTGHDLEQAEHRGIAVYSKSLIKALKQAGAEVWLLTEFHTNYNERNFWRLNSRTKALIRKAQLLEALATGIQPKPRHSSTNPITQRMRGSRLYQYLKRAKTLSQTKEFYRRDELVQLNLNGLDDNPYLRLEKLGYLENVDGLISADSIYSRADSCARKSNRTTLTIDLCGFDGFITTAPKNIRAANTSFTIQTVHDIIPIEYYYTGDSVVIFTRRLEASRECSKAFVSRSTAIKYCEYFEEHNESNSISEILIQPPSLAIDDSHLNQMNDIVCIKRNDGMPDSLIANRYILFNSSIEPRKNVSFLIRAFKASRAAEKGWKLCITGMLKKDDYSNEVVQLLKGDRSIILTDYIDENAKARLFLYAGCLASPSLVEGFGIPVLDGACLGIPVLASDSDSHLEIGDLYDFCNYINLLPTTDIGSWAETMQRVLDVQSDNHSVTTELARDRMKRYKHFKNLIFNQFSSALSSMISRLASENQSK